MVEVEKEQKGNADAQAQQQVAAGGRTHRALSKVVRVAHTLAQVDAGR
jgi:hypothetical protein